MRALQNLVPCFVDQVDLFLGKLAPKQKYHVLTYLGNLFDDGVCELSPAKLAV